MVERTSSETRRLRNEVEGLVGLLERFRTDSASHSGYQASRRAA
jgi:methyl-accepting chemotaxis protein